MADIHLHKLKDGRAFAECYKQLVANKPSTENLIMLGDAYMAIQVSTSLYQLTLDLLIYPTKSLVNIPTGLWYRKF